jgi:flavin reductase (DIM6/NTAB) family NADH-FMN oxidoreductase RutF
MSESNTAFREALSRFASGVTVVAADTPAGLTGFTATAFASVSLDPPLVLVCVAKNASVHAALVGALVFGVSVLDESQTWIAEQFARSGTNRFAGVALRTSARVPLIDGAIAHLECGQHAVHDVGDHTTLVGRVLHSTTRPGRPLLHYARAYGGLAPEHAEARRSDTARAANGSRA